MTNEQRVPKGVRQVLQERGDDTTIIYGDDLRVISRKEPDFVEDAANTKLLINFMPFTNRTYHLNLE